MSGLNEKTVKVSVTGASGQIGYAILFRILNGDVFGKNVKVDLQLIDINIDKIQKALHGVALELEDCAFPLLNNLTLHSDPHTGFVDTEYCFLIGAKPRGPGMERKDLLKANGQIFKIQGVALNEKASRNVKVVVVGNPANTNAYIAMMCAPDLSKENFSAMMRLDHNRAVNQVASKLDSNVNRVSNICVWGNHSPTMVVDITNGLLNGSNNLKDLLDEEWVEGTLQPTVAKRGAKIIDQRGLSSAASAASAAIDHMHDWVNGTLWTTMGVPSQGEYGIPEDIISGFPVNCNGERYSIIQNLDISDALQKKISISIAELREEQENIKSLL
ncbi:malate dehydrogenase [Betaproteobacteria bacterium]|nr:malate dehydrogenase [Betaproteobacteria bacterium]